ncbi:hypothetical protein V5O48_017161 [Marasmius crinis-equi]|uniref:Uncharacterized protein n=1 Tax=Marasmius crinis-equi TaxID=585013 RepID=A0ABR3EPS2_9AGAR
MFCCGPEGPGDDGYDYLDGFEDAENVPSSVEFLQEDVVRRFLTGFKSKWADVIVVGALDRAGREEDADLKFDYPTVISPLTNTPIAASGFSRWRDRSSEKRGDLLENGQTRLDDPPAKLSLESLSQGTVWLSQAWSIFHAHGVSLEDDLSKYKLIVPYIYLDLSLSQSDRKLRRRRQQPLFLFIRPLPSTPLHSCTTSSHHYWSFNEGGRSPLSADICHHLGLPITLELKVSRHIACIWSNDVYKTIHEYQVTRGYDPRTTDLAQSLGYRVFKLIHNDSNRFEEADVVEDSTAPSTTSAAIESDWTSVEGPRSLPQDEDDGVFAEGEIRDSSEHSESCSQAHPATTQAKHKGSLFSKIKRCWRRLKAMKLKDS